MERKLNFCGQLFTLEQFAEELCEGNQERASGVIEELVRQGRAAWIEQNPQEKEQKQLMKTLVQQTLVENANLHDQYDTLQEEYRREKARAGRITYDAIELDFAHLGKAQEFQIYVANTLRLESEITLRGSACVLKVFNCTDKELNAMSMKYKAENAINSVVHGVDKVATGTTKAVDYAAKQVVAPAVQVGAKAGVNILKTLAVTSIKSTGSIVSAIAAGSKQCVQEISTDPDVLRASRDLLGVKDATMRAVRSHSTSVGNGVRIIN